MKTNILLSAVIGLCFNMAFAQKTIQIDQNNSILNWTGHSQIGNYSPAGTLNFKDGQIIVKNNKIISALLKIDMKSMKQENENLLNHLKNEDFFDVGQYPESTIKINKIEKNKAYGQLTIKNKTMPIVIAILDQKEDKKDIITGSAVIDRTEFGIIYNSGNFFDNLGDKAIKNTFDVNFKVVATF